jgi:hypothetical protein
MAKADGQGLKQGPGMWLLYKVLVGVFAHKFFVKKAV